MDQLITAHMLKQRQKSDFKSSFQFTAPNKHLPRQLKEIEEMKQYMVLNGLDEAAVAKYIKSQNSTQFSQKSNEAILIAASTEAAESIGANDLPVSPKA